MHLARETPWYMMRLAGQAQHRRSRLTSNVRRRRRRRRQPSTASATMPLCPVCSFRLKVTDQRCENCGALVAGEARVAQAKQPAPHPKPIPAPRAAEPVELLPILSPALSVALRIVATVIAGLGLAVTGFFWFKGEAAALILAVLVLAPVLAFHRSNTVLLLALAALSVVTGFSSCVANFRWAGG